MEEEASSMNTRLSAFWAQAPWAIGWGVNGAGCPVGRVAHPAMPKANATKTTTAKTRFTVILFSFRE
jgi:hypothetical protein